jgi:nitroreductase
MGVRVGEAIRKRRSIRKWQDRPVPRKKLERLLDAARLAPSSRNGQQWEIVCVTDRARLREMVGACMGQEHVGQAGALLFIVNVPSAKWGYLDPAIALDHVTLRAVELGLGTCWIGAFDEREVRRILGIPDDRLVVIGMTVGYPAEEPAPRLRRPLEKAVRWERY